MQEWRLLAQPREVSRTFAIEYRPQRRRSRRGTAAPDADASCHADRYNGRIAPSEKSGNSCGHAISAKPRTTESACKDASSGMNAE